MAWVHGPFSSTPQTDALHLTLFRGVWGVLSISLSPPLPRCWSNTTHNFRPEVQFTATWLYFCSNTVASAPTGLNCAGLSFARSRGAEGVGEERPPRRRRAVTLGRVEQLVSSFPRS